MKKENTQSFFVKNVEVLTSGENTSKPTQPNINDCVYAKNLKCIALHPTDPAKDKTKNNAKWP